MESESGVPFATPTVAERKAQAVLKEHPHLAPEEAQKLGPDLTPDMKRESRKLEHILSDVNPCAHEMQASLRCLDENNYVQTKCVLYHENYRRCRKFWDAVYRDRKRKGIEPFLPAPEQRPETEQYYRRLWGI